MFLILRIIKCYLSWIWQTYTKYLPLGNYVFHYPEKSPVFPAITFTIFTCFRLKASIFPSSWSLLWCLFQPHVMKTEGRANLGEWFSEDTCLAGWSGKWSTFFAFYKFVSPFSFVAVILNQPIDEDRGFVHAGVSILLFTEDHLLLLCKADCGSLKKHPLLGIMTDSILLLLSIDSHKTASHSSLITIRTATPMHDRKSETTPKMTLFYQHNNMAKYSCKEPV